MHVNCRSIASKLSDLHLLVMQVPVKYLILTETWLNEDNSNVLSIPGYRCVSRSRGNRIGGGVAILIKEDIIFHVLDLQMLPAHASYEGIFVNVPQRKGRDLVLGAIYRPLVSRFKTSFRS